MINTGINQNNFYQQKQQLVRSQYNKIYSHELAHKMAGGALAGGIVIEKNSQGIPVSGHVAIKMPTLNEANPDETITEAKTVINSALAPSDPSEQDLKVASEARKILNQAQNLKRKQGLDYLA